MTGQGKEHREVGPLIADEPSLAWLTFVAPVTCVIRP